jgi:hypothetical protein
VKLFLIVADVIPTFFYLKGTTRDVFRELILLRMTSKDLKIYFILVESQQIQVAFTNDLLQCIRRGHYGGKVAKF